MTIEPKAPARSARRLSAALSIGLLVMACQMDSEEARPSKDDAAREPAEAASAELVRIGEIDWYVDYAQALEVARTEDKALWVHFGENPG